MKTSKESTVMLFVKPGQVYARGAHFFEIKTPHHMAKVVRSWFSPSAFGVQDAVRVAGQNEIYDRTGFWKQVKGILKSSEVPRKIRRSKK